MSMNDLSVSDLAAVTRGDNDWGGSGGLWILLLFIILGGWNGNRLRERRRAVSVAEPGADHLAGYQQHPAGSLRGLRGRDCGCYERLC